MGVSYSRVHLVPEYFPLGIQSAISDTSVKNGDTVSVWGEGEPPFTYYENIIFRGKDILVINRDFLPGGNNDPSTCIIDGSDSTRGPDSLSVVTFKDGESTSAIVKGFTINNGHGSLYNGKDYGGGILCVNSSPVIISNRITMNTIGHNQGRGGGIAIVGEYAHPRITHNFIHNNYALERGGGISFEDFANPYIDSNYIYNNGHTDNDTMSQGGGICGHNEDTINTQKGNIFANVIERNIAFHEFAANFYNATPVFRSNVIIENGIGRTDAKVITCVAYGASLLPDFGNQVNLGLNIFKNNGGCFDLVNGSYPAITLNAQGNYWNTINTDILKSRIYNPDLIAYDPVAASDRVFSVDTTSRCSTDVIVTGDLTVNEDVILTIIPGKTFRFATTDDYGEDGLCELIVNGELQAIGSANQKITFTSFATTPAAGDWYGVGLKENSIGTFGNCSLEFAYCGIDAESSSVLSVDSSIIISNQV